MQSRRTACRGGAWSNGKPALVVALVCGLSAGLVSADALARSMAQRHAAHAKHDAGLPDVTFTGFRALGDGRSLVYVELSAKVPVSVDKQARRVVYRLEGARVSLRNNKNPLITSAFASNLVSARLLVPKPSRGKHSKKAQRPAPYVDLVLELRSDVTPTHVVSERAGGAVLEITIPAAGSGAR